MKKLSIGQRKIAAEIIGNLAVAWFSAGVISPIFTKPKTILDSLPSLSLSLIMSLLFSFGSLLLVKRVET